MDITVKLILAEKVRALFGVFGVEGTEQKIFELLHGKLQEEALGIYRAILNGEV
jgi:hypothetical protein